MSALYDATGKVVGGVDDRLTISVWLKRNMRKVFPDHWSFLLGEIALFSFILLLLSGAFLTLWFKPSMAEVTYEGSYAALRDVQMSEAFASTLDISFDVRGGLLMRQIHHWAALVFISAMVVHATRILLTGAFRKPREINYTIGILMLILGVVEGFAGYSLPDDLLSGSGLRIADGIILATPIVGTYMSFFLFGGEFPGDEIIPRLFIVHVLLIPGMLLALVALHLIILWYQKHTHWTGAGKTEHNVVGPPFFPIYVAKAGGFQFIVWGVIAAMGAFLQINPVWIWGPYSASEVSAGTQPDWYMGWLDGLLRIMPNWETHWFGFTWSWNILVPAQIIPGILIGVLLAYPWIEQFVTGDRREHHTLQRPRNQPVRTGLIAALATFIILGLFGGGNDFIALIFHVPINTITWALRILIFVGPADRVHRDQTHLPRSAAPRQGEDPARLRDGRGPAAAAWRVRRGARAAGHRGGLCARGASARGAARGRAGHRRARHPGTKPPRREVSARSCRRPTTAILYRSRRSRNTTPRSITTPWRSSRPAVRKLSRGQAR